MVLNLIHLDKCQRDAIRRVLDEYPFFGEGTYSDLVHVYRDLLREGLGAEEAANIVLRCMDILKQEYEG